VVNLSLEWKSCKIGDVVSVRRGSSPRPIKDYVSETGMPWVKIADATKDQTRFINFTSEFIKEEGIEKSVVVNPGDLIVSNSATPGLPKFMNIKACVHDGWLVFDSYNGILKDFLYYYFIVIRGRLVNQANGSVFKNLKTDIVRNFDINLPDLETQEKIVKILSQIDKKIETTIKINKNLLSIADAIYKKEFQNFDTYSEDELIASDFGLIPKNWHYKTLDEISDVGIGKTPPRKETWWFSEQEGVKWVSIKDLGNSGTYIFETSEYLTNEAIEKFNVKLIPINTVILSFKLTVGRIGITTEEMVTNEAIAHFKLSENSVITKEYLYLYLKNFNYEELGSTSSIAKAINSKIVKKIPILIPNNKINEFKDLFENLFNKIKSNQLEINKLTKLRDTLLPKLMSGEIDVSKINCDLE
jgi:type I restriction enzyme S subunit